MYCLFAWHMVLISLTFYVQHFRMNVFRAAFLYLRWYFSRQNNIDEKAARKMLVKASRNLSVLLKFFSQIFMFFLLWMYKGGFLWTTTFLFTSILMKSIHCFFAQKLTFSNKRERKRNVQFESNLINDAILAFLNMSQIFNFRNFVCSSFQEKLCVEMFLMRSTRLELLRSTFTRSTRKLCSMSTEKYYLGHLGRHWRLLNAIRLT